MNDDLVANVWIRKYDDGSLLSRFPTRFVPHLQPESDTMRSFSLALLAGCLLAGPSFAADAKVPDGNWFLASQFNGTNETRQIILSTKNGVDGKVLVEFVAQPPVPPTAPKNYKPPVYKLSDASVKGNVFKFTINVNAAKTTFEGIIDPKNGDRILGSQGDETRASMVNLVKTDSNELTNANRSGTIKATEPYAEYVKLGTSVMSLRIQISNEKDDEKKDDLNAKLADAQKTQSEKSTGLLAEAEKTEKNPAVQYFIYSDLLGSAGRKKVPAETVNGYVESLVKASTFRGPRFEEATKFRVADLLNAQEGYSDLALAASEELVKLSAKAKTAKQITALKSLATAQTKAKKTDDLKITTGKIDKLELVLDAEYKKEVPPFKPEKFAGRKDKSANRVAVLELFTGAQCPPCVAADVACDALEKAYTPKDVVMVQYHMHIPGPDPMTNTDTQGRWDYYRKLHPMKMGGVPSSLFNGTPKSGGGGGMANSEAKYDDYAKILGEMLDEKSDYTIDGTATLKDGTVSTSVKVKGADKADEKIKVRVLLCEEEVRFPGGNGVRFHHQVVRSSFGKLGGWEAKAGEVKAIVKLDDLKAELNKEIDKFEKDRSFKFPSRPMDMKHLKVIVLVQDDDSGEILQAAQMEVK